MKQHFESKYMPNIELYKITPLTLEAMAILTENEPIMIDGQRDEITQGCINRIVDNLNKLAGHNAKKQAQSCKCGGTLKKGQAMESTVTGTPDFPGGEVVTMSFGGPGKLIECNKCTLCGMSYSL